MTPDWPREAIALAASLTLFAASYRLGSRRRSGWLLSMLGNALWTAYGVHDGAFVILAESLAFQALAVRGWLRWRPRWRQRGDVDAAVLDMVRMSSPSDDYLRFGCVVQLRRTDDGYFEVVGVEDPEAPGE
jgi:hypothetical protein